MLNKKILAGGSLLALALTSCSNDSIAGGSVDTNATAEKSCSSTQIESSSSGGTLATDSSGFIVFKTQAKSTIESLIVISVYEREQGAMASCGDDEKSYNAKARLGLDNKVEKSVSLKNYGSDCENVLEEFKYSCSLKNKSDTLIGACDEAGNLEAYCSYSDDELNFSALRHSLLLSSDAPCNRFVTVNMQHTLDKYSEQFVAKDVSGFDSHVLAYNGDAISNYKDFMQAQVDSINANPIVEISDAKAAEIFPMTASIAGARLNPEHCKLYAINMIEDFTSGHVLTKVSKERIVLASIRKKGFFNVSPLIQPVVFLVQDCENIIDENTVIEKVGYGSDIWCSKEIPESFELALDRLDPDKPIIAYGMNFEYKLYYDEDHIEDFSTTLPLRYYSFKPNPACGENGHEDAVVHGEWYRADLAE